MTLATGLRAFWTADPWGTPAPPAVPTSVTALSSHLSAYIEWDENIYATGFRVRRNGVVVYDGPRIAGAGWQDTGLTNLTTYSYTVSSYNAAGESAQTAAITVTPSSSVVPAAATNIVETAATLNWGNNAVTGFTPTAIKIWRDGQQVATLAATATTYTDYGIPASTDDVLHQYIISKTDAAGVEKVGVVNLTTRGTKIPWRVAFAEQQSASASAMTVNMPAGILPYDVIYVQTNRVATAAISVPAGWLQLAGTATSAGGVHQIFYRRALPGAVPTSLALTFAAAGETNVQTIVYRGCDVGNGAPEYFPHHQYNSYLHPTATTSVPIYPTQPSSRTGRLVYSAGVHTSAATANVATLSATGELNPTRPDGNVLQPGSLRAKGAWLESDDITDPSAVMEDTLTLTNSASVHHIPFWLYEPGTIHSHMAGWGGVNSGAGTSSPISAISSAATDWAVVYFLAAPFTGTPTVTGTGWTNSNIFYDSGTTYANFRLVLWTIQNTANTTASALTITSASVANREYFAYTVRNLKNPRAEVIATATHTNATNPAVTFTPRDKSLVLISNLHTMPTTTAFATSTLEVSGPYTRAQANWPGGTLNFFRQGLQSSVGNYVNNTVAALFDAENKEYTFAPDLFEDNAGNTPSATVQVVVEISGDSTHSGIARVAAVPLEVQFAAFGIPL